MTTFEYVQLCVHEKIETCQHATDPRNITYNIYYIYHICDRLWENRAQRGMRRRRKKIDLVLKIVLNKPNEGNG